MTWRQSSWRVRERTEHGGGIVPHHDPGVVNTFAANTRLRDRDRQASVINNCVLQQSPYWLDCGLAPILINCVRIFRCGRQWPGTGQWLIVPVITLFVAGGESGIERRSSGGHPTSEWKSTAFIFNGFSHGRDSDLFGNWRLIWTKAWRLQSCWKLIHLRWDLNCCELSVDCG